jgi:hypothetical protein
MFFQQGLPVQENAWWGIDGDATRDVDVLWVCNNRVESWEEQIVDKTICDWLDERDLLGSELWNFPHYETLAQLHLSPQQVNMLAQLSWWNVTAAQNSESWKKIFD